MKGCVASTCDCLREGKDEEECRCQALTHYVTRCLESDSSIKLDDWRIVSKCCECLLPEFWPNLADQEDSIVFGNNIAFNGDVMRLQIVLLVTFQDGEST